MVGFKYVTKALSDILKTQWSQNSRQLCGSKYNDTAPFRRSRIVFESDVAAAAEEVLRDEEDLLANTKTKENSLHCSKISILEKLIGFRFWMHNPQSDA